MAELFGGYGAICLSLPRLLTLGLLAHPETYAWCNIAAHIP